MTKKIKILTLGDMPLSPSGVGIQSRLIIEGLLDTGKYKVITFGGAIKHQDYKPIKTKEYGDDWVIFPVNNFGTPDMVRSVLRSERPDILWFMTDPRFFGWLWQVEDEIRPLTPMVYYHVWDNYPYPTFNRSNYLSNDAIVCISKVTHDIVKTVTPEVESHYLPHAVLPNIFKPLEEKQILEMRKQNFPQWGKDKVLFFWNNRNARRKKSGTVMWWFKEFLDEVGHNNAMLLMHTEPKDSNGPNLNAILEELDLTDGQIMFSEEKMPFESLAAMYNMVDCTINISDAEGFGLATLESLSCATPIIVSMTGGLQEQVTDGESWFGVGIEPASKAIVGSQEVPFIFEDRVGKEDFLNALRKIYKMTRKERRKVGEAGKRHVEKNYNFKEYIEKWDEILTGVNKNYGSWDKRKGYKTWELKEVA